MVRLRVYKPADVSRATAWARANPERSRAIKRRWKLKNKSKSLELKKNCNRKKSYGISLKEYNKRLALQGTQCSICSCEMVRANLDHCHKDGQLRGFLCHRCNGALHILENESLLAPALQYLDDWEAIQLCQKAYA